MSFEPIKLGSAAGVLLIFQDGSTITTNATGIQECSIKAICPDGKNVFNYIPLAGATYDSVFGNDYLPNDFKVDYTGGGAQISYDKGKTATVTLSFKRPDPVQTGSASRKISLDSAFTFYDLESLLPVPDSTPLQPANGDPSAGFPEPVVTVTYNAPVLPNIGVSAFALPNTPPTLGFPVVEPFTTETTFAFFNGYDSQNYKTNMFALTLEVSYGPDPSGWQQTGIKATPVADQSVFEISETWRARYILLGSTVLSRRDFSVDSVNANPPA